MSAVTAERRPRRRLLGLAAAVVLTATSCRTLTTVTISSAPNGSGSVTASALLDADAVAHLGGEVAKVVRVADLRRAGWSVRIGTTKDGGVRITTSKPFARPAELQAVLSELGGRGAGGVFRDWHLRVDDGFVGTDYHLDGRITLTGSLDQFSDAEVAAALDGFATGRSPEELAGELKANPQAFGLVVAAHLPGDVQRASGLKVRADSGRYPNAAFLVGGGSSSTTVVTVLSARTGRTALYLCGSGLVCILLGVFLIVARRRTGAPGRESQREAARAASLAGAGTAIVPESAMPEPPTAELPPTEANAELPTESPTPELPPTESPTEPPT